MIKVTVKNLHMEFVSRFLGVIPNLLHFFRTLLGYLGFEKKEMEPHMLEIYVKWGSEKVVPVKLHPDWLVSDLKNALSEKLNVLPSDLRIIFAGKELTEMIKLQDCDVGQHSVIHAVRSRKTTIEVATKTECSIKAVFLDTLLSDDDLKGKVTDSRKFHFFVYCSDPCKKMCPGKLRVRCFTCKEGTLTVNQDPTCWDDVLIPNRITGVCQAEGCDGSVAEFFFKCANHVTSPGDTAVALYLIRNNFKNVPCIACTDVSQIVLVFPCSDKHVICLNCFQEYCASCLNERRFIQDADVGYSLNCAAGCPDSLIKEPHHFKLLGEEQYSRYQRFGAEECLLQAGGVLCPRPGCGAGILPDPECRRVVCSQQGVNGCGFVFCRECLQGYHIGPCELPEQGETGDGIGYRITDERAGSSRWDEDTRNVIQITTKPCPKCRTPTERDGGCMHMVCTRPQCGFHWCWVCQEEWTRDCMGNHWFG